MMEEILIKFWTYLTAPGASVPVITGLIVGFAAGLFLSKPMWDFLSESRRFKREDREAQRQRKEDAAKRRLEACQRRKNEKRPLYGIPWDRNGTPYCPVCGRALHPFVRTGNVFKSACYACCKEFYCHTRTLPDEVGKLF